jgi:hypothetical protein
VAESLVELLNAKGLLQEPLRPEVEDPLRVARQTVSRRNNDGHVGTGRAQALQNLTATEMGHDEVQNNHIKLRRLPFEELNSLSAVGAGGDAGAQGLEQALGHGPNDLLIINDEDSAERRRQFGLWLQLASFSSFSCA